MSSKKTLEKKGVTKNVKEVNERGEKIGSSSEFANLFDVDYSAQQQRM